MAGPELDLLVGRLAVHYRVLSAEQVKDALRRWRGAGSPGEFGDFLVSEGLVTPDVQRKLLRALSRYLERENGADGAARQADSLDDTQPTAEAIRRPDPGDSRPPAAPAAPAVPLEASPPPDLASQEPPDLIPAPSVPQATSGAVTPPAAPSVAAPPAPPRPSVAAPPAPAPAVAPPRPAAAEPPSSGLLRFGPDTALPELLLQTQELGASDLHIHSGARLKVRIHGRLVDAIDSVLDPARAQALVEPLLTDVQRARLAEEQQVDFAFAIPQVGRFRANAYRQQRGLDAVFRAIPLAPPTFTDLGLPETFERFAGFHQGIVLFTGPAGCGKSSTMAATVAAVNRSRPDHIITVEDPIEFVHTSQRSVVNQREVGPHTESFARALRAALREDPDVIVIGELRDLETISLALTAAETGHLVLGTLHTSSAIRTVNRLLGVFPPDQQAQIRMMLSESLRAVVSQRLILRADGSGRVAAAEILLGTKAVGNLIREQKTFQLTSLIQTSTSKGMCLLDSALMDLVKSGTITKEAARQHAEKPEAFAGRGRQQQDLQIG